MILEIVKVENGAQYEGNVFDFWIDFQTSSGKIITVFDSTPFDLRGMENKSIEVVLFAGYLIQENNSGQEFSGEVVSNVAIENVDWTKQKSLLKENKFKGFKTEFGTFLLDDSPSNFEVGQKMNLRFGRIDILAAKY